MTKGLWKFNSEFCVFFSKNKIWIFRKCFGNFIFWSCVSFARFYIIYLFFKIQFSFIIVHFLFGRFGQIEGHDHSRGMYRISHLIACPICPTYFPHRTRGQNMRICSIIATIKGSKTNFSRKFNRKKKSL